jgi:hypothetical protein
MRNRKAELRDLGLGLRGEAHERAALIRGVAEEELRRVNPRAVG